MKTNLDNDQFLRSIEGNKRKFEEEIRKIKDLTDQFDFLIGESKLDAEKRNSLIKDIMFMIEEL